MFILDNALLRNYVHRMFLSKKVFIDFIYSKYNIQLPDPKSNTYIQLLEILNSKIGEESLLPFLGLTSESESIEKILMIPIFVAMRRYDLAELANEMGIRIDHRMNRGALTRAILVNNTLNNIKNIFIKKSNEDFIIVINQERNILGPDWISFLSINDDLESARAFMALLEQIDESIINRMAIERGITGNSSAQLSQRLLTKFGSKTLFITLTNLILNHSINVEKILDVDVWGIEIDPRYGIRYNRYSPIENLCDVLCTILREEEINLYLKHNTWDYRNRMLVFCIENDPFEIINEHLGITTIRKYLKKDLLIDTLPKEKDELIKLLLFQLGFPVPEILKGFKTYRENLLNWSHELKQNLDIERLRGIATSVFVSTEKIIKDIIYFYGAFMIQNRKQIGFVFNDWGIDQIEQYITNIYPNFLQRKKTLSKATLGELIGVLSVLNKKSISSSEIKTNFSRDYIIPKKSIKILNDINVNRKYFIHDVQLTKNTSEMLNFVLKKLIDLTVELLMIYPVIIKPLRLETSAFRTTYLIAKDDEGKTYKIYLDEYLGTDIFKSIYLMKRIDSQILINPTLVKRS